MKLDKQISEKFHRISFICMLLVVLLHSNIISTEITSTWSAALQLFVADGLCRVAVPFFFMISGFFFYKEKEYLFADYRKKLKNRFFSLVVPYLCITLSEATFLFVLTKYGIGAGIIKGELQISSANDFLEYIFVSPRLSYQLWFIRDLFVLTILSPALFAIISVAPKFFLFFLFLLCNFYLSPIFIREDSFIYFSIGAIIALHYEDIINLQCQNCCLVLALTLVWLLMCGIVQQKIFRSPFVFLHMRNILGVISLWTLHDIVPGCKVKQFLLIFSQYSFWLYLIHEPILTIMRKILLQIIPYSHWASLFIFLSSFAITVVVCISLAKVLKKGIPHFYKLICGGR